MMKAMRILVPPTEDDEQRLPPPTIEETERRSENNKPPGADGNTTELNAIDFEQQGIKQPIDSR